MQTTVVTDVTPEARCRECRSPEIATMCHHCGLALCGSHTPAAKDFAGRPLTLEFKDLGLAGTECGEDPIHCQECMHFIKPPKYDLVVVAAVIALIGLLLFVTSAVAAIIFLVAGVGLGGYGFWVAEQRKKDASEHRPQLPLLPGFSRPEVVERLQYQVIPTEGIYDCFWEPVEGSLSLAATFGKPDRRQLAFYREKYGLGETEDVWYRAGFVVPRGTRRIKVTSIEPESSHGGTVIPLFGKTSSLSQVFSGRGAGECRVPIRVTYTWRDKPARDFQPVRVVPSFVQEAGRTALDVEILWTGFSSVSRLEPNRIESIELKVPNVWGPIVSTSENAVIDLNTAADGYRTVLWRRVPVLERGIRKGRSVQIRFLNPVNVELQPERDGAAQPEGGDKLVGRVEVSFNGTLSGVRGADIFYPVGSLMGTKWTRDRAEAKTYVGVNFEFNMADLRYQSVHIMPDKSNQPGSEVAATSSESIWTSQGVLPDHSTVAALTNAMNEQGFYVKRVVENPPTSWGHANVVNRCWDIAGRRYNSIHPVDFHMVLTGEEVYSGEMRVLGGTTNITLSVQGPYVNEAMRGLISDAWDKLVRVTEETMPKLIREMPGAAGSYPEPQARAAG
jgi:hypothetical protein